MITEGPRRWFGALTIIAAAAMAEAQTQPVQAPPVFGAEVTSVFVDVFVTDKNEPVPGLTARDFILKDDGISRPFEILPTDSLPVRLILVFDTSFSVRGAKLERLQAAAVQLLDGLRPQDEAGLIAFSEEITWPAPLSTDHEKVRAGIRGLRAEGGTAVNDALFSALLMPRSALRTLVVVFSDGEDNMSWLSDKRQRVLVERFNALIYIVAARSEDFQSGLRNAARGPEPAYIKNLRETAEVTGGSLIEVKSADQITAAFVEIMERMKSRYVLRYDPSDDLTPGWHRLEVGLKSKKGKVRGRSGYWVEKR